MTFSKRFDTAAPQPSLIDWLAAGESEAAKLNTCIQCGSCTASCVAAGHMGVTPRKLWRLAQLGQEADILGTDSAWNCTTCSLCEKRCPRGIPLGAVILRLRELQAGNGKAPVKAGQIAQTLHDARNITGDPQQNRFLWIENMGLAPEQAAHLRKGTASVVYYTGCVSSLFPQTYKIPQSLTGLLLRGDADFALLDEEWCCGYPLLAAGQGLEAIREFARHNLAEIRKKGATTVLMSCPTCLYMFTKVYPKILGAEMPDLKIVHYSEYLAEAIPALRGELAGDEVTVTYHDPCDLGRKLHITRQPRDLMRALPGVQLREMRFHDEDSKCCGGGGNLEMNNPDLSLEIALKRVDEALATGSSCLVTCCQQCKRTLQNAVRKSRARLKVYDLLEFIDSRLTSAQGGGAR